MHAAAFNISIVAFISATGLALAHLIHRSELVHRVAGLATIAGWVLHTVALIARRHATGRPPLGTLSGALSVAVWVVVLLEMWVERQYGVRVLGAFVFPVVIVLMVKASAARSPALGTALVSAWVRVHIGLALIGIAAFVLNFAGALMYVLQERQIKVKRQGALAAVAPSVERR